MIGNRQICWHRPVRRRVLRHSYKRTGRSSAEASLTDTASHGITSTCVTADIMEQIFVPISALENYYSRSHPVSMRFCYGNCTGSSSFLKIGKGFLTFSDVPLTVVPLNQCGSILSSIFCNKIRCLEENLNAAH